MCGLTSLTARIYVHYNDKEESTVIFNKSNVAGADSSEVPISVQPIHLLNIFCWNSNLPRIFSHDFVTQIYRII